LSSVFVTVSFLSGKDYVPANAAPVITTGYIGIIFMEYRRTGSDRARQIHSLSERKPIPTLHQSAARVVEMNR